MRVLVITAMYPSDQNPASGTFVKEQVESLREIGIDVDVLVLGRETGSYLRAIPALWQQLKIRQYDIIHAHYGLTGLVARMQVKCPVVVTYHGSDLLQTSLNKPTLQNKIVVLISKLVALSVTQRIVVADILKPHLRPAMAITIPMGVDLSLFKPISPTQARQQLGLPMDRQLVLFPAHPQNSIKRYDLAKSAIKLLPNRGPKVKLIALQGVPHSQVPLFMNACDVMILTSTYEASPCVIKEAMACNLPIVSVDVGDVAERIKGVEGCYLCERTPEDIAAKLQLGLQLGYRPDARSKVSNLSLPQISQRVLAVYQDMLTGHP
jgi:glycosyltransferase involved in cell wall biosynthesis